MNKTILIGRLTADPESKVIANSQLSTFTLAVKRPHTDKTDFIRVNAWNGLSKIVDSYAKKGRNVLVEGYITVSNGQRDDGSYFSYTAVSAESIEFLESKSTVEARENAALA